MVASTVFHWKRTGIIPEHLKRAYSSIRVRLMFQSKADEIFQVNQEENKEQQERKQHTEMDNIGIVSYWMKSLEAIGTAATKLKPDSALDVYRYACLLKNPANPASSGQYSSSAKETLRVSSRARRGDTLQIMPSSQFCPGRVS